MDSLFPTLLSKTFFIVSAQLFVTWLTTQFIFVFFKRIDPKLQNENPYTKGGSFFARIANDTKPGYRWVFSSQLFYSILAVSAGLFLVLLFWGINQNLGVSISLFSAWSFFTGVQLEYVLLDVGEGLGRKVLALTATIVFATAFVGIYSKVDFGFLGFPLFVGLLILVVFNLFQIFASMDGVKQRILSGFGVVLFTFYLTFDFNSLVKRQNAGDNNWPDAMHLAINLYLDIINLFLELLRLLSKHHH